MTSSPALQASSGWTSLLFKQRERAACPQLRCVPPDLRGDGARHASHESLPPSKPYRPHLGTPMTEGSRERTLPLYGPSRDCVKLFNLLELSGQTRLTSRRSAAHNLRTSSAERRRRPQRAVQNHVLSRT